ncbi:MAG: hypothetical protein GTO63_01855 [Anaerolineae bacterium]|nr:hypothetical protein [Anaerolineae bacterium]NIN93800.1 hypothetical protein [Anaerolineae bacterium]NIQ76835.1 hypothetical protein [Anaerolineae bacterium]
MVAQGKAALLSESPLTVQLPYAVELPDKPEAAQECRRGEGKSILLHACCGPCSTYVINRLRDEGFEVTGFWYNPNIHPFSEHQKRLGSFQTYAESTGLPLVQEQEYQMPLFFRLVAGHEARGERCRFCYEMRLRRAAMVAAQEAFDVITTTLLISPHQNQDMVREIGERVADEHGVGFYFENFRRGWSERGRLTREHELYRQQYCGCIYSEWERYAGDDISRSTSGARNV